MNWWPRDEPVEDVHERVAKRWDFSTGFPLPRWSVACPCCRENDVQLRHITYHEQPNSKTRYRADVSMKCRTCSLVFTFGVVCPPEHYRAQDPNHRSTWDAKEIAELIKEA